ncbi:hypothetical protein PspLS_09307 [Pyricularia sp. CBS 133598]|nr:hypothetical protein PspLS_09307 [Pyricularia sp. CBS 133598]
MWTLFNSKERNRSEWEAFFRAADERLYIKQVWATPEAPTSILEVSEIEDQVQVVLLLDLFQLCMSKLVPRSSSIQKKFLYSLTDSDRTLLLFKLFTSQRIMSFGRYTQADQLGINKQKVHVIKGHRPSPTTRIREPKLIFICDCISFAAFTANLKLQRSMELLHRLHLAYHLARNAT